MILWSLWLFGHLLLQDFPLEARQRDSPTNANLALQKQLLADDCYVQRYLDEAASQRVDELLIKYDAAPVPTIGRVHIDLINRESGAINFCDIERRSRRLGLNTRLLALPPNAGTYPLRDYALTFVHPMDEGIVPRYTLWTERGGEATARQRLERVGLDMAGNLRRLNFAGLPAPADAIYPSYRVADTEDRTALNPRYAYIYSALSDYRAKGLLSDRHNTPLMMAAQTYVGSSPNLRFSVNDLFARDVLQFFVVEQDPSRIMIGLDCNCAYLPGTSIILCDSALLDALSNWVGYGRQGGSFGSGGARNDPAPVLVEVQNEHSASLLMHWLVGHEIGHFVYKHDYDSSFLPNVLPDSPSVARNIRGFETEADQFAVRGMPRPAAVTSPMTLNFLIQESFRSLRSIQPGSDSIVVRDSKNGHPNFMTRLLQFTRAYRLSDSMWDDLYGQLRFSEDNGATFGSICRVARR